MLNVRRHVPIILLAASATWLPVTSALAQVTGGPTPSLGQARPVSPGRSAANVWVVDDNGGPGVDFATFQGAVSAASDGDVVLMRGGYYTSTTISAKGLVVVADEGATVGVNYTSEVRDLAADQLVVLRGLTLGPTSVALLTSNSVGTIWLSDCSILGDATFGPAGEKDALRIENCANVVLDGCVVSSPNEPYGEHGCIANQSRLTLWNSTLSGGRPDQPSASGGAGCIVVGGSLFAAGCTFLGGIGGFGGDWGAPECFPGGDGGAGLHLTGAVVTLRDCLAIGGPGGSARDTRCLDGPIGPAIDPYGATTVDELGPAARTCDLPRVLREGAVALFELTGRPGELASVHLGVGASPTEAYELAGVAVTRAPWTLVAHAMIGPDGTAIVPYLVPEIPPTAQALVLQGQAVFASPDGPVLGSPFVSVVLEPGF